MALECTSKRLPPLCDLDIVLVRSADGRIFDVECGLLYQSKFLVDLITANGAECCSSTDHEPCTDTSNGRHCGRSWWHPPAAQQQPQQQQLPVRSDSCPPVSAGGEEPPAVELVDDAEGSILLRVNVHARIIEKVLTWCRRMAAHPEEAGRWCRAEPGAQLTDFERVFFDTDNNTVCEIINAAYVLKIGTLTEAGCKVIADKIRHKSPAEMRQAFGIRNDFTPQEQTKIRRETRRMLSTMSALERYEQQHQQHQHQQRRPTACATMPQHRSLPTAAHCSSPVCTLPPAPPAARTTFARLDCATVSVSAAAGAVSSATTGGR